MSLVVSLFLIGGMIHLVVSTQKAAQTQIALVSVQESGRFALEAIGRELRKAGYRASGFLSEADAFPLVDGMAAGQVITGSASEVTLRYRGSGTGAGDGWMQDCLGANVAETGTARVTLALAGSDLRCRSINTTPDPDTDQTQPLVSGVEAIQVTYGEDTNGDGYADSFRAAAAVSNWLRVVGARVDLRLVTDQDNLIETPQPYTWNGTSVTPGDRRLRRIYSSVFSLRNRLL